MDVDKWCPFQPCRAIDVRGHCEHFLGWTTDGKTVNDPAGPTGSKKPVAIGPADQIVKTGVSARVYRK